MDSGVSKPGSESQNSNEPVPPGTSKDVENKPVTTVTPTITTPTSSKSSRFKLKPSSKGVENAKKRLRAFSIQKKTPIKPIATATLPKVTVGGNPTVLIGKLSSVKLTPKVEDVDQKKPPKPPKPGMARKNLQDSYTDLQKRTLTEIEDMKRKMELVELGIPLGLICPSSTNDKAMPTKAMPPIKTFLDPAKLDEIIREAKKAKAQGKEFKFDYKKVLPDYDNPFQRNREEILEKKNTEEREFRKVEERRNIDRYENDRRHLVYKKDDKEKRKEFREKFDKFKDRRQWKGEFRRIGKPVNETDVDLNDYLVCDSWSLENEDKTNSYSPIADGKSRKYRDNKDRAGARGADFAQGGSPRRSNKLRKLQPVMDTFKFEIDEDEILDMFDENTEMERFTKTKPKKDDIYDSPDLKLFDFDSTKDSTDALSMTDDTFLESVINEIKQEDISDEGSQDKGLVEYDSPIKDDSISLPERLSVTPELDDRMRYLQSSRSDYSSDGYRSTESGYKSTESGYKSNASYVSVESSRSDSYRSSMEKDLSGVAKSTVDSLETWSFVLKICQPLLFRHDRNKCYKETRVEPKLWYTENPKVCSCVKDRSVVYEELEMCKMNLVDRVYGCDQIPETEFGKTRGWYPRAGEWGDVGSGRVPLSSEWEADDSQHEPPTPQRSEDLYLDREYQRFMQAVWPEVAETKSPTPRSTTPVRQESRKKKKVEDDKEIDDKKKVKKIKLSSEGWSQESDIDEEGEKSKKVKVEKDKVRKRKHSVSLSDSADEVKKRKKDIKKKASKKAKSKTSRIEAKRRRLSKKYLKKLKEKQKKKKKLVKDEDDSGSSSENNNVKKKKEKKLKRKKQQKKKKAQKKKAKAKSSSSSSSSTSSSSTTDTESEAERRKKKKKNSTKKNRKQSTSESQSEDLFDVNILNNIKTERLTDDEKKMEFSPRRQKPREIINVKELQNDFVGNNIHIKKEVEEKEFCEEEKAVEYVEKEIEKVEDTASEVIQSEVVDNEVVNKQEIQLVDADDHKDHAVVHIDHTNAHIGDVDAQVDDVDAHIDHGDAHTDHTNDVKHKVDIQFKVTQEPQHVILSAIQRPDENLSQCSSQESTVSKDPYEKDDSHLRPSSQNSNYSFNDVISASHGYQKEDDIQESYEEGNYEMYEQLAMAYQSDVAKQPQTEDSSWWGSQKIETVVRGRPRGEIKCDWRPGDSPAATTPARPSRWGLKPGEVNIVLTGGGDQSPVRMAPEPVYQIQSLANRTDNSAMGYDEAYEDMYGASDRLQYGDCFAAHSSHSSHSSPAPAHSSLDDRISRALRNTGAALRILSDGIYDRVAGTRVLGEVAKEVEETDAERDGREKGILITKSLAVSEGRGGKRVSFADGYKPGQDSDVEEPPVRKKKKARRFGCAWPCPASHPDHVPLWDALPPPPPPPGDPPTISSDPPMPHGVPAFIRGPAPPFPPGPTPPPHMLRLNPSMVPMPPYPMPQKMDPSVSLPAFMPPEPPPGMINFS